MKWMRFQDNEAREEALGKQRGSVNGSSAHHWTSVMTYSACDEIDSKMTPRGKVAMVRWGKRDWLCRL